MSMRSMLATGATVILIAAGAAQAQGPAGGQSDTARPQATGPAAQSRTTNKVDQKFLTEAEQGDLAEVKMGQLAQQKGGSDQVKQFGATLEKDHGEHAQKVQQMAQQMGVTVPSEPSAKQKADYTKMNKLMGAEFDRKFAQHMVADHKSDIRKYQAEAKKSGPVADMAKETVPVLQKHLQMAQALTSQKSSQR